MEEYRWRELDYANNWVLYAYKLDSFVAMHKDDPMNHDRTYYKNVTAAEAIEMFRNDFWRNV